MVIFANDSLHLIEINEEGKRLFNFNEEIALPYSVSDFIGEELTKKIKEHSKKITEKPFSLGVSEIYDKNGKEIYLDSYIQKTKKGKSFDYLLTSLDVNYQVLAKNQEINTNLQLRALYNRIEKIQEIERNRVSREIHDELGQVLTALKIRISLFGRKFTRLSIIEVDDELIDILGYINNTIKTVKKIALELKPVRIEELGFSDAIRWYVQDFSKKSAIKYKLTLKQNDDLLSEDLTTTAYRLIQESLTNVAKHSKAMKVNISIRTINEKLKIEIADNGIGMKFPIIFSKDSLGIIGMKERVNTANGTIRFLLGKLSGTRVIIDLPIKN